MSPRRRTREEIQEKFEEARQSIDALVLRDIREALKELAADFRETSPDLLILSPEMRDSWRRIADMAPIPKELITPNYTGPRQRGAYDKGWGPVIGPANGRTFRDGMYMYMLLDDTTSEVARQYVDLWRESGVSIATARKWVKELGWGE